VQEQVEDGTEIILGIKTDPGLGAFVVVGLGGVFTELLNDAAIRPAPVDTATAREMIGELRGKALLDGYRGQPPRDIGALAETVARFSRFAVEQGHWLREADLNPVLVLEDGNGVRIVDVLLAGGEEA
jgi:acetyltransferase